MTIMRLQPRAVHLNMVGTEAYGVSNIFAVDEIFILVLIV